MPENPVNRPKQKLRAILFDLDGTLLDTAPDLADALNHVLTIENREILPYETIRPSVSNGAAGLIQLGFGTNLETEKSEQLKKQLIAYYQDNICRKSTIFKGMSTLLEALEKRALIWGIVTNKPAYLTNPLLIEIGLMDKASCVISGDSTANSKPHPEPLLAACKIIDCHPIECIYIGDAKRDIEAGINAGMETIVAQYGYIPKTESSETWGTDHFIDSPLALLNWLDKHG